MLMYIWNPTLFQVASSSSFMEVVVDDKTVRGTGSTNHYEEP